MDSVDTWDFGLNDEIISPMEAGKIGQEEKPTEEAKETKPKEPTGREEQEPQGSKEIKISPDLVKDAQDLGEFLKKGQGVEDIAIKLASMMNEKVSKQQESLNNALDSLYFATPQGQQVKRLVDRYGKYGMTKEAAVRQIEDMGKYQAHLEQRMGTAEENIIPGLRLSDADKKVLKIMGNTPEQYYKDAQEVLKGNYCHYLDNGAIEIELDLPMTLSEKGVK